MKPLTQYLPEALEIQLPELLTIVQAPIRAYLCQISAEGAAINAVVGVHTLEVAKKRIRVKVKVILDPVRIHLSNRHTANGLLARRGASTRPRNKETTEPALRILPSEDVHEPRIEEQEEAILQGHRLAIGAVEIPEMQILLVPDGPVGKIDLPWLPIPIHT